MIHSSIITVIHSLFFFFLLGCFLQGSFLLSKIYAGGSVKLLTKPASFFVTHKTDLKTKTYAHAQKAIGRYLSIPSTFLPRSLLTSKAFRWVKKLFPDLKKTNLLWSKDVRQIFHFDDLQGLVLIVNTVSVHVSLAALLVQDFFFLRVIN